MVAIHKYVISNTLENPGDGTTMIGGDLMAPIREVKDRQSGDLLLICGPELFAQLSAARLIDAYLLYTSRSPSATGSTSFGTSATRSQVHPERIVPFSSGVTLHHYRPTHD